MLPGEKNPEALAEDIMNEADQDLSADDLTRGTEVYEEIDEEADEYSDDPVELDFEPEAYITNGGGDLDYSEVADAYVGEDDY